MPFATTINYENFHKLVKRFLKYCKTFKKKK